MAPAAMALAARAGIAKAREDESLTPLLLDVQQSSGSGGSNLSASQETAVGARFLPRGRVWDASQRSLYSNTSFGGSVGNGLSERSEELKNVIAKQGAERFRQILAVRIIERRYAAQSHETSPRHLHDPSVRPPDWGELCFVGQAAHGAIARYVRVRPPVPPTKLAPPTNDPKARFSKFHAGAGRAQLHREDERPQRAPNEDSQQEPCQRQARQHRLW